MNERIKQLWEDSDEIKVRYPEQGSPVSVSEQTLEKFAELIVKECIETLRLVPYNSPSIEFDEEIPYQEAIRKHFGVEE
jgi:hypothetical protein